MFFSKRGELDCIEIFNFYTIQISAFWRQSIDAKKRICYTLIYDKIVVTNYYRSVKMIDLANFKIWLLDTTKYSERTISNIVSRFKRADALVEWHNNEIYMYQLEHCLAFKKMCPTVRSQIKKAVNLYFEFEANSKSQNEYEKSSKMKVLSLFANIGVAEAYLERIGVDVVVANELIERRAALYSKIYRHTHMICGDITNDNIKQKIISASEEHGIDIVMATPPCQGMSTAGRQNSEDIRNTLICEVVDVVTKLNPKYVFIENVPLLYNTEIEINGKKILIPAYINNQLADYYVINAYTINTKDYSVPQNRERAIILMSRKGESEWVLPARDEKIVTMRDAIGDLPELDPYIKDVDDEERNRMFPKYDERKKKALSISPWHNPPEHIKRQVIAMQHTASGCTAFDNPVYFPVKENGDPVKGYRNTYKRQNWDTPAYTVTMDNRKISSQNNVHPGRKEYIDENGEPIYSDARTLTLYELMKVMSLPDEWPIPLNTSEAFLRRIIGEGIPPLFVKKVFEQLKRGKE